jgi:HlyD family secretion protein
MLAGGVAAYFAAQVHPAQPPVFNPATNPYPNGIYANGIIESEQTHGSNINIFPEVPGVVREILVSEGSEVAKGTPLFRIDDSIQRAVAEQAHFEAEAAGATLEQLRAQPRKENLEIAEAQVIAAQAAVKSARDQMDKQQAAYDLNPRSISRDALDNAINAFLTARANLAVAERQYELTKAGTWIYDLMSQERQYEALQKAYESARALLSKYTVTAANDGIVLAINTTLGSYVSSIGAYDTYTEGMIPPLVMGRSPDYFNVRCYVDEILLPRLPDPSRITAQMSIRGSTARIPLDYVRVQPFVSPKIQLSDQRTERVDVRVLPIIFRFQKPKDLNLFPGQLVDVYIGEEKR